jgi:threonine/homoserine/homoserine lactone efflux protein
VDPGYLVRGFAVGFSIAAPVGPIGVLCIRRTLSQGAASGFASGLGAATADAIYGGAAAFGLTSLTAFLVGQQLWLRVVGGAFLCYLGVKAFTTAPAAQTGRVGEDRLAIAYASTFVLTLTNPLTILSFAAVFAGLGLGTAKNDHASAGFLVAGVFLGSALWWLLLSGVTDLLRSRVTARGLRWVNRISGAVIAGFGAVILLGALR